MSELSEKEQTLEILWRLPFLFEDHSLGSDLVFEDLQNWLEGYI